MAKGKTYEVRVTSEFRSTTSAGRPVDESLRIPSDNTNYNGPLSKTQIELIKADPYLELYENGERVNDAPSEDDTALPISTEGEVAQAQDEDDTEADSDDETEADADQQLEPQDTEAEKAQVAEASKPIGRDEFKLEELKGIAQDEGVDTTDLKTKPDYVAAINAKRAETPGA